MLYALVSCLLVNSQPILLYFERNSGDGDAPWCRLMPLNQIVSVHVYMYVHLLTAVPLALQRILVLMGNEFSF